MKVVALAGGVGGAKLVDGLSKILLPQELTIIVNTGDDFMHLGLNISPDLDTICYTLAGISNKVSGWGIDQDNIFGLQKIISFRGPDWFNLGNIDIGNHIFRSNALKCGFPLSHITALLCHRLNIKSQIIPMTDDAVPTLVETQEMGTLSFQEYFVFHHCDPKVVGFKYHNHENAYPVDNALIALSDADLIIICPSNPWVSIDPILSIRGYYELVKKKIVIGVSPLIGGKTVKGPAAKMFKELGINPTSVNVAAHYRELLNGFLIHTTDQVFGVEIERWGIISKATNILMLSNYDRQRLAEEVLNLSLSIPQKMNQ